MVKSVAGSLQVTLRYAFGRGTEQRLKRVPVSVRPVLQVDLKQCVGCKICEHLCPANALRVKTVRDDKNEWRVEKFRINADKCIACGLCAEACPEQALILKKEEK